MLDLKNYTEALLSNYNCIIKKIKVSNINNSWEVILKTKSKLNTTDIDKINKDFKRKFHFIKNVKITFHDEENKFRNLQNCIEKNKKTIIKNIKNKFPFLPIYLNNNWKAEGNKLIIPIFSKEAYDYMIENEINKEIERIIEREFKILSNVVLKEGKNEELINKQKKKEIKNLLNNINISSGDNKKTKKSIILGKNIKKEAVRLSDVNTPDVDIVIEGEIFKLEYKELKNKKVIIIFNITDYSSSITAKFFANEDQGKKIKKLLEEIQFVKVRGKVQFDNFIKENILMVYDIESSNYVKTTDNAKEKRVELHMHTQYSAMDGVSKTKDIINKAVEFGHKAIAITDHGVLQAYPDAMKAAKGKDIKVIYGVEGYLVNDSKLTKWGSENQTLEDTFVVFDIETTGLSSVKNEIIEIAAVKIKNKKIVDSFNTFVKPKGKVPPKITELTGITNEMVFDADSIDIVLPKFIEYCNDNVVVAHNAKFDVSFIENNCRKLAIDKKFTVIDTLSFARNAILDLKKHNLKSVTKYFKVKLENHHRALDDTIATAKVFIKLLDIAINNGAECINDLNSIFTNIEAIKKIRTNHIILLAQNKTGLKNLYKLVSESHLKYFYRQPRIPRSLLHKYREGIIVGSACEQGEVFKAVLDNKSREEVKEIVEYYDYLEVQPIANNYFLIEKGMVKDTEELKELNKKIINLGEEFQKPVVATCDVHFMENKDSYYRKILMHGKGFSDAENQPPLFFRTTEEMLKEFEYLGEEKAYEVVVKNTNHIADFVENILPIPDGTFPPKIEGSDQEIEEMVMQNAYSKYGKPLPEIVENRIKKELNSIIKNGYSVLYLISHKLVKKSLDDGYLVGSRGSVGSSLVATLTNITEVNPLPPHYICSNCNHSEFFNSNDVGVGCDLPEKNCPNCGNKYSKDGFDIPFEVFLGFDGDKEPDIDLNFSGDYQPVAHKYTEELFGEGNVFRAGTISTIAERTAYGFVKNYLEETNKIISNAEIDRLINGCTGIKRTTGQHPGGIMVVPRDMEIYDFCPIQKPADDQNTDIITTHFDYHSISGRLLKLDILGHDDPTVIKMLEELTSINAREIPLDDKDTMSLFINNKALKLKDQDIGTSLGTYGIPEFGTNFVREMLIDTKPTAFAELIRISGLSHGTDVWLNNAQELVKNNTASIKEVISTRDDIMVYLIYKGLDSKLAFTIMERVRKGKGLTEENISAMKEKNVPQWYIDSCKKIQYMFPKAHAAAYVTMAFRIAYFKVHFPLAFYATYFTVRADDFDAQLTVSGKEMVREKLKELRAKGNQVSTKEKSLITVLELSLEMYCRGFDFLQINLYKSHYNKFKMMGNSLLPPFNALEGIGDKAAINIFQAKKAGEYISIEDLQERSRASKTVIEVLQNHGCLSELPKSNQLSLF